MTITLGERQLQPALSAVPNTMVSAAFTISSCDHLAGVMNTGVTLPSSDVKGTLRRGAFCAFRFAPSFCRPTNLSMVVSWTRAGTMDRIAIRPFRV